MKIKSMPIARKGLIVCLGRATFDIDTNTKLVGSLPVDLGAAIVVINDIKGVGFTLFDSLGRCTMMPIEVITEGCPVQSNRVFVLTDGWDLHVDAGAFHLKPISKPTGWTNVITVFLGSLSKNWRGQIIAVILEGLDGDGTAALRAVRAAGGITIAQKMDSTNRNMPFSAIASGNVDLIVSIEDIPEQIIRIAHSSKEKADGIGADERIH
jgi:two-component system chemotaxis response regulator CheB